MDDRKSELGLVATDAVPLGEQIIMESSVNTFGVLDAIAIDRLHWGDIQRVTNRFGYAVGPFTVTSDSRGCS